MKFIANRGIGRLALPITRYCSRKCPECPAWADDWSSHVPVDELKWVGKMIGPIKKIEVTGGEPTLHPDFVTIAEGIHSWFQCNDIMLLTNGFMARTTHAMEDWPSELLLNFDRIYITHYTKSFAALYNVHDNDTEVEQFKLFMGQHPEKAFWVQEMDRHVPSHEAPVQGANGCMFDYDKGDMISYYKGQIYGCCTAWQLGHRGKGIVLTETWRSRLSGIELPCETCFQGVKK